MPVSPHISHIRKRAISLTRKARPTALYIPAEDRKSLSGDEARDERNFLLSRGNTAERLISYHLAPDRNEEDPHTTWTIEAVDSEASGKEEVPNVQPQHHTLGARHIVTDESDREEILYPRNLGVIPSKPQSDFPPTSNHDMPKVSHISERALMPENDHSTFSPSTSNHLMRKSRNRPSGGFELNQSKPRSLLPKRVGSTSSTADKAKDDKVSARKYRGLNVHTPSPRDGKGKERRRESAGLTTNTLKPLAFSRKIPEQMTRSSSSSNIGDGHHSPHLHTAEFPRLPLSPSPSTQQPLRDNSNAPIVRTSSLPQSSKESRKGYSPSNTAHSPLRGAAQEGWSSLDDVATAEALRTLDRLAGQRARARVHSFGRPSTASSNPSTPVGTVGRAGLDTRNPNPKVTSDSGKSGRGNGAGGLKESPSNTDKTGFIQAGKANLNAANLHDLDFNLQLSRSPSSSSNQKLSFPLHPFSRSTSSGPQISASSSSQGPLSPILSTDGLAKTAVQVINPAKTLDRAAHSNHPGTAAPSASTNPPLLTVPGSTSSVHRNRPKRLSPSLIPTFRRSPSQSTQISPAHGALSSASQNTYSTNEMRSLAGPSTHKRGESTDNAPPAKSSKMAWKARHYRSSSAPLSVQLVNTNANEGFGSPSASSSPHASLTNTSNTSPYSIPAPFLPRVRRGYWNRRGDHLTPDGHVVYAPLALAYPTELAAYPLQEEGYQNEEGAFLEYVERPELSASLPWKGRPPEKPYESFVVYVDSNSNGLSAPHWSSIDPFPRGRAPLKYVTKRPSHKKSSSTGTQQELKDEAGSPSQDLPRPVDPWDLDTRLAAFKLRRPKSPTSSSSSYGSAHSTRSRASSFSGSAGGHIPGTNRDVMEFPFGYPTPN